MNRIALITGATAGIGEATAILLAQNNFDLILTGRRNERLKSVKEEIAKKSQSEVVLLNFDIRNQKETENALDKLPEKWKNIDVLINNAGLAAGFNTFQDGIVDDWERMIDTNVKGLLYISRIVSSFMIKKSEGHIIFCLVFLKTF
jgi:NADP-dependent 3-hydroxy acid dehydrogenase YdfG